MDKTQAHKQPDMPITTPEAAKDVAKLPETGGPRGPEPTRYGDWEVNGRVSDF